MAIYQKIDGEWQSIVPFETQIRYDFYSANKRSTDGKNIYKSPSKDSEASILKNLSSSNYSYIIKDVYNGQIYAGGVFDTIKVYDTETGNEKMQITVNDSIEHLAVNYSTGEFYVVIGDNEIAKFDSSGNEITSQNWRNTINNGKNDQKKLFVDQNSDVWYMEKNSNENSRVYRWDSSGTQQLKQSFGSFPFKSKPFAIKPDGSYFYLIDEENNNVRKFDSSGTEQTTNFPISYTEGIERIYYWKGDLFIVRGYFALAGQVRIDRINASDGTQKWSFDTANHSPVSDNSLRYADGFSVDRPSEFIKIYGEGENDDITGKIAIIDGTNGSFVGAATTSASQRRKEGHVISESGWPDQGFNN
jgi:hypothetical protein